MSVRARAHIRLSALQHNLARVRALAPGRHVMAAIKADGYGHGALQVAAALDTADALAVATLEEAMQLRWHGEARPVVILGGVHSLDDCRTAAEQRLQLVIHDPSQLPLLAELEPIWSLAVWIKLDSGMHRLGFPLDQASSLYAHIQALPQLSLQGWLTHLACADEADNPLTQQQIAGFGQATDGLPGARSIANSAGIVAWPDSHADWVRPGIMLYGSSPVIGVDASEYGLQPVMSLRSCLIARQQLKQGDGIGYGHTWHCPQDMPVGIVGIGYGDGYPRHAPSGTPVAVGGKRVPLVGRVSMDMLAVDLRDAPDARVGDEVELWGDMVHVDEVARAAGTISYELFCRLSGRVETLIQP